MKLNDPAQLAARMVEVDADLDLAGMPSYSHMWATNARLRAELARAESHLQMMTLALSKAKSHLLHVELVARSAASVEQVGRQLARLRQDRDLLEAEWRARFDAGAADGPDA